VNKNGTTLLLSQQAVLFEIKLLLLLLSYSKFKGLVIKVVAILVGHSFGLASFSTFFYVHIML